MSDEPKDVEEPVAEEPVAEPPAKEPVAEPVEVPVEEPSEEPVEEPAEAPVEETPAEEPVAEEPKAEEPPAEPVEEPAEEPVAEEPVEETPSEKPITEEPATEEPAETPAKEQPEAEAAPEEADELQVIDAHAEHPPEAAKKAVPRKKVVKASEPKMPSMAAEHVDHGNPMREIIIDKVVINMGVGEAGEKIIRAKTLLKRLTGQDPFETISRTTNRDLAIRQGQPIGCKVTLRGPEAEEFLKKALWVKDNKLPSYCFDPEGNCSFGIPDYTEFQEMKYDPDIGIFGMDIATVFKRKGGYRTKHRKLMKRHLPHRHRISAFEGKQFMINRFSVEILEVS